MVTHRPIVRQGLSKHIPEQRIRNNRGYPLLGNGSVFSVVRPRLYNEKPTITDSSCPCAGGIEYLHRIPASCRRRRKGKFRIWGTKVWSRVPRDSDPRMTVLMRTSSNCKGQTRPLVWESAPHQQSAPIICSVYRSCHYWASNVLPVVPTTVWYKSWPPCLCDIYGRGIVHIRWNPEFSQSASVGRWKSTWDSSITSLTAVLHKHLCRYLWW
jgi:hypothetical protein